MDNCRDLYQKPCDSCEVALCVFKSVTRGKQNIVAGVRWSVLVTKTLFLEGLCSKHTAQRACSWESLLSDNKVMDQDCVVPWLYSVKAIQRTKWFHEKEKLVGFLARYVATYLEFL